MQQNWLTGWSHTFQVLNKYIYLIWVNSEFYRKYNLKQYILHNCVQYPVNIAGVCHMGDVRRTFYFRNTCGPDENYIYEKKLQYNILHQIIIYIPIQNNIDTNGIYIYFIVRETFIMYPCRHGIICRACAAAMRQHFQPQDEADRLAVQFYCPVCRRGVYHCQDVFLT